MNTRQDSDARSAPALQQLPVRQPVLDRRRFLRVTAGTCCSLLLPVSGKLGAAHPGDDWDPERPLLQDYRKLVVQPVFMYRLPVRREQSSWKSWGGVQSAEDVVQEVARITRELQSLASTIGIPLEVLPVVEVTTAAQAVEARKRACDVTLVYACTGGGDLLRACCDSTRDTLIFVRHRSGPVYYWYEALSVKYLETRLPGEAVGGPAAGVVAHVDDVVVDELPELAWRLRAIAAVRRLKDCRVVALGGAWGKYSPDAPQQARERFGIEIIDVGYDDLERRLERARGDAGLQAAAARWADRYLAQPGVTLNTDRDFVVNGFVLYRLFKDQMAEHGATTFTVKSCMGTIIPMSRTTACLTLSLLNDEGYAAFCESDFVVIPAGMLLRHLTGLPVFLHNSTFPHDRMVTCAHCTAPRRMDGKRYEPARIVTHYESDYGAAPKVDVPPGQRVSFINPDYTTGRWVGFHGTVRANPFYEICRSQQEVEIEGRWRELLREVRDSHWLMVYGDWRRESGYAARKLGIKWVDLGEPA